MFGRLAFLSFLILASCARPNYQDEPAPPPQLPFEKISRDCKLNFVSEGLCANFLWEEFPTEKKTGSIFLAFWDPAASGGDWARPSGTPGLILWMPSMGHGSAPVKVEESKETPGVYRLTNVYFTMHGNWDFRFQLKKGADVVEQIVVPFEF